MSKSTIHPTAIVEPGAKLGKNVTIEAYAIVKGTVTLKDNVVIKSHALIEGNTTIGENTSIYPYASIGTKPQDLKYKGEKTFVEIGKNNEIREFVTINSSSGENTVVRVGDNCLIMAYCHIAHNCEIGSNVIMSNNATLGGHVFIEDRAIIGGLTPIHQFSRVGTFAMVGGLSRVTHDIAPYTIGGGVPYKFGGLNMIGLKRNGFSLETRRELSKAFKLTFRSKLFIEEALVKIEEEVKPLPEVLHWVNFCKMSKRGLMGQQGLMNAEEEDLLFIEDEVEEEEAVTTSLRS
jgi:UDP-N-acetylglucosamine acyltransferase